MLYLPEDPAQHARKQVHDGERGCCGIVIYYMAMTADDDSDEGDEVEARPPSPKLRGSGATWPTLATRCYAMELMHPGPERSGAMLS